MQEDDVKIEEGDKKESSTKKSWSIDIMKNPD